MKSLKKQIVVFFHEGTLNGKAAAYAAWEKLQDKAFYEGIDYSTMDRIHSYDVTDKDVYILGLSIAIKNLDHILYSAKKIVFIDHHKTSMDLENKIPKIAENKFELVHSVKRASCCLAWRYFIDSRPVPDIYLIIEDQTIRPDRPEISNSHLVCAGLNIYYDFMSLSSFFQSNVDRGMASEVVSRLMTEGSYFYKDHHSLAMSYMNNVAFFDMLDRQIPVLNIQKTFVNDCLYELAKKAGISISYTDAGTRRYWSIRTHPDSGIDASAVAQLLEGGGSSYVGGFTTHIDVTPDKLNAKMKAALAETVNKSIELKPEEK